MNNNGVDLGARRAADKICDIIAASSRLVELNSMANLFSEDDFRGKIARLIANEMRAVAIDETLKTLSAVLKEITEKEENAKPARQSN